MDVKIIRSNRKTVAIQVNSDLSITVRAPHFASEKDIEKILKNVEVVAESDIDDTKINVGCHIIIHDFEYDEDLEFSIVGSTQTNSLSGKISNESPLGHALIGHEVGDIVEVEMGDTVSKYKVLDIKKKK